MTSLHSFDVFDTLVTRAVGHPLSVFLLLGRTPVVAELTGCSPEEFARLRRAAEQRARGGRDEVTLQQIYTELSVGLGLSSVHAAILAESEVALERRLSRPVPSARTML